MHDSQPNPSLLLRYRRLFYGRSTQTYHAIYTAVVWAVGSASFVVLCFRSSSDTLAFVSLVAAPLLVGAGEVFVWQLSIWFLNILSDEYVERRRADFVAERHRETRPRRGQVPPQSADQ